MTVHLLKLCVGVDNVQELKTWQEERLKRLARADKTPELCHRTLQTPRRRGEVLSPLQISGSLSPLSGLDRVRL